MAKDEQIEARRLLDRAFKAGMTVTVTERQVARNIDTWRSVVEEAEATKRWTLVDRMNTLTADLANIVDVPSESAGENWYAARPLLVELLAVWPELK